MRNPTKSDNRTETKSSIFTIQFRLARVGPFMGKDLAERFIETEGQLNFKNAHHYQRHQFGMPFLLLLPVSSILGAVLFLGERPDIRTLIGGVFVIAGVAAIVFLSQGKQSDKG